MIKNLKIFFSGTKRPMTLKLGMQYRVLKYCQVDSVDDPGLTLIYFKQGQIWSLMWVKGKTMDFSETIVVFDVKVGRSS